MPLFSRDKPPLIEFAPRPGDPVRFDHEEEYVVSERRGGLASSLGDTLYDEDTAREIVRSQESRALLGLAIERIRANDFHGAASCCVKALGIWESGAAWWLAAEVHRAYGDRTRADKMVDRADEVAAQYGMLRPGARPYRDNYRGNELKKAIKSGLEGIAMDTLFLLELQSKVDYLNESSTEESHLQRTIAQWLKVWRLAPRAKKSVERPNCGKRIKPEMGLSATRYWCECGFMHSVPH